jgi:hypothetical protein
MNRLFDAGLPEGAVSLSLDDHRAAFKAYLRFCRASLSGQTGLQPWPIWATQAAVIEGYAQVLSPDAILREDRLAEDLTWIARQVGVSRPPEWRPESPAAAHPLESVADDEVRALCFDAYRRDYEQFGFSVA